MRPAGPPTRPEDPRQRDCKATGVEDLGITQSDRGPLIDGCRDVAVEVGPPVESPLVPEAAVELDDDLLLEVLHVAVGRRPPEVDLPLPLTCRQPVPAFDIDQVHPFQHRLGTGCHVGKDRPQPSSTWKSWKFVESLEESGCGRPSGLADVGEH
jgi:hypothetical protein